ncbi:DinB family protein [uncultured Mucilaginibacter sp.]|uniref:DinB family protein n=1 Tax=uncultured Mucilaginibacter sp. TaxID=797541 RepID=UPI0025F4C670|nr:DinB family protein [uncultured Mucilaginibacter sp.]
MKHYFKQLFEYDRWANQVLLDKFEHQFPQNERIYEVFSHMISAQRIWLDRVMGLPQSTAVWAELLPHEMQTDMVSCNRDWLGFIDDLQETDFNNTVHYTNSAGDTFDTKLVDIMTHVINHGTHHRGGLMVQMKEEGFVLSPLDFIVYVRR